MKKIFLSFLIILLAISVTGCKKQESKIKNESNKKEETTTKTNSSKSLVLYFSATGTTKEVAKKIAKVSNSDVIEIIPKEEYTKDDLDYNNDNSRANKEQNNDKSRPEIKNKINIENYDTIYIGYPIWWGTNPKIILTLLDQYNFTEKKVIPFCTSGSTDISKSVSDLKKYKKDINWGTGKRFDSNLSDDQIKEWLESI